MIKRGFVLLAICLLSLTLTACYDAKEPDEWAYVYTIGVDRGVADALRLTVQLPKVNKMTGGQSASGDDKSGSEGHFSVITVDCATLYDGINMINTSLSRELNYTHTKYILISENFAREGLESFVNSLSRVEQIRRIMYFAIVRGEASQFIEGFSPVLEAALPKVTEGLMQQSKISGLFINSSFGDLVSGIKSTKGQTFCALAAINDFSSLLPSGSQPAEKGPEEYVAGELPRKGGNPFEFVGSALFFGDKMVGELNGAETRVVLMVRNEFRLGAITIPDPLKPEKHITFEVYPQKKTTMQVTFENDRPVISLQVFLEGELVHLESGIHYETQEMKPILEDTLKAYIKNELDKTLEKCRDLNCDVFGFGAKVARKFPTIQEWEAYNWLEQFKYAKVNFDIQFYLRHTGTIMKTNPTKTNRSNR